jgi:hypothetical protein
MQGNFHDVEECYIHNSLHVKDIPLWRPTVDLTSSQPINGPRSWGIFIR